MSDRVMLATSQYVADSPLFVSSLEDVALIDVRKEVTFWKGPRLAATSLQRLQERGGNDCRKCKAIGTLWR
jgi:hypothetical protein